MRFWFYTLRAIWRINRGRWHVWRDAPDDVVRSAASLAESLRDSDEPSAHEAVRQAQAEFALRTAHNRRAA